MATPAASQEFQPSVVSPIGARRKPPMFANHEQRLRTADVCATTAPCLGRNTFESGETLSGATRFTQGAGRSGAAASAKKDN